jgi:cell wall-associated NlpC family hydrolase
VHGVLNPDGSGQDAVDLGRKFLGQNSADIKGKLPNFTAAGGQTNNCADFVSSLLESTGRIKGHHINVEEFERSLRAQGYAQVPAGQAQPGDVWISNSRGHTELYAGNGRTIGSNNDRPGHQVISERPKAPGTGVYYHLAKPAKTT